jgi:hypothetical protein
MQSSARRLAARSDDMRRTNTTAKWKETIECRNSEVPPGTAKETPAPLGRPEKPPPIPPRFVERDEIERGIGRAGLEVLRRLEITYLGVLSCSRQSCRKVLARMTGAASELFYMVERMNNTRKLWEAIHD